MEYLNNFNKMLKGEEWLKLYYFRLLRLIVPAPGDATAGIPLPLSLSPSPF